MSHDADDERYTGMRAMWLKVMIRAAFDWVSYRDHRDPRKLRDAKEAEAWLFHGWGQGFNSFENLCRLLQVSPQGVRRWATSLSKDQITKIEHLDRVGSARRLKGSLEKLRVIFDEESLGGLEVC